MFGIGTGELLVIFVLALIIIGPNKLPELARMLGKGLAEFRKAADDIKDSVTREMHVEEEKEKRKLIELKSSQVVKKAEDEQIQATVSVPAVYPSKSAGYPSESAAYPSEGAVNPSEAAANPLESAVHSIEAKGLEAKGNEEKGNVTKDAEEKRDLL